MSSKDLVLFACPGLPAPEVVKLYEDALEGCELRWIAKAGRSAVFTAEAMSCRVDGRVLPTLVQRYGHAPMESWASVSLISYSAGYGLAREVLRSDDDRGALSGYVALDSVHSGLVNGKPHAPLLEPFVEYAKHARDWRAIFALGHTDVQTPQTGPEAFASTTQVAQALIAAVGEPDGGWIVRAYDLTDDAHQQREHGLALTKWGPELVRGTLGGWLRAWRDFRACVAGIEADNAEERGPDTAPSGSPLWRDARLAFGERAVEWSLAEMRAGVKEEPPGSNTSRRIAEYLAPCNRNGKPLGLKAAAWCAAAACAAGSAARLDGEQLPHEYRASGLELVQDAVSRGTWRAKGSGYAARRGDVGIYKRTSKSDPAGAWQRHVVRVETAPAPDGAWRSIGGNESDHWQLTARRLDDQDFLGFIEYPT